MLDDREQPAARVVSGHHHRSGIGAAEQRLPAVEPQARFGKLGPMAFVAFFREQWSDLGFEERFTVARRFRGERRR